ncbi:bifunctional UDP-N-acetylmuramoyl-tripeptide:D-alanyl-D-alanine ligase/alanine racemase [Marinigracilibium pacificum]|uniref:Alanine racemase n=1 Tax=Marinigracilibium pacificum TaxID=2729599 RepID=A0A848IWZ1_9BACT|nr:bifunctional UDP-N-acetylmuramoyl-tripeptide:D-alanyl-D-alanine ligase/alanine racemase [Marinigracilibium pacificum]NMM46770.1 bifunctional UDP-N-acetylmuramoyl-tripeptide:D-alanyl-D-alanine ligase/alanine racemase [Marinigracilibium pacificum]
MINRQQPENSIYFSDLKGIVKGRLIKNDLPDRKVSYLVTDSRRPTLNADSVFLAIKGINHDGHNYINSMIDAGIRQFIIEDENKLECFDSVEVNVFLVENTIKALQNLGLYKRNNSNAKIIAVTGSNGKTIIKEWISQLLYDSEKVIQSPLSYNSQIGVPLSVWGIESYHTIGVFEAGISQKDEMPLLEKIIKPLYGIYANIGSAHESNFNSIEEKAKEKAKLFIGSKRITYCGDHEIVKDSLSIYTDEKLNEWSVNNPDSETNVKYIHKSETTDIEITRKGRKNSFTVSLNDAVSLENLTHCLVCLLDIGYSPTYLQDQLPLLKEVDMRLTIKRGVNNSFIIDDTYNNDMAGLEAALTRVNQFQHVDKRVVVLSDIQQSSISKELLYSQVEELLKSFKIDEVITIGEDISSHLNYLSGRKISFSDTSEAITNYPWDDLDTSLIIVKGARKFQLEKIVRRVEKKIHGTTLEINLASLANNLNFYRQKLDPGVKMMVMVKALAYGSGAIEIGKILQFHRVDYLAVAYPDEGVNLRRNGIYLPIMVMNPSPESFDMLHRYDLEAEVYSLNFLRRLNTYTIEEKKHFNVHIKLDTGMHRLGFNADELEEAASIINSNEFIHVKAVFSHLAGADSSEHVEYSNYQNELFSRMSENLANLLDQGFLRHLSNSAAIIRFPEFQYDMVRLGIGLYGIEVNEIHQENLIPISKLKTIISQIRTIKKNETVGYGRVGKAVRDTKIATIAIGYADGFSRIFSNGNASVYIKGQKVPVFGNVCMDMTMIDITDIEDVKEGDEVVIFETTQHLLDLAKSARTIPYEILTNISERVNRVFLSE